MAHRKQILESQHTVLIGAEIQTDGNLIESEEFKRYSSIANHNKTIFINLKNEPRLIS